MFAPSVDEGEHSNVECQACHLNGVYIGTPTNCFACHEQNDAHKGQFGQAYELCHVPQAWDQVSFDHSTFAFPLTGKHTDVACESCHAKAAQVSQVTWEYLDSQGAENFTGSQKVVADKNGLRVIDSKATSKIKLLEGGKIEDFAAWMKLGDIWRTSGDFSIPKSDPAKYKKLDRGLRNAMLILDAEDKKLKAREAKGEDVKKLRRKWKEERAAAVHGQELPIRK